MANKNHELDKPIIEAAKQEFLKNGFQETSINIIAQKAGVTTGAIYTRYKGKDELFCSLMEDFFKSINDTKLKNKSSYMNYYTDKNFNNFIKSILKETADYIDILFNYYDECKLLLCCSNGSSIEKKLHKIINNKITETKQFIKKNTSSNISDVQLDFVELVMQQQLNAYSMIIKKGYDKEETIEYIKTMGEFIAAGWKKIFKNLLK